MPLAGPGPGPEAASVALITDYSQTAHLCVVVLVEPKSAEVQLSHYVRCNVRPTPGGLVLLEFFPHLEVLVCPAHDVNRAAKYCLLDLLVPTTATCGFGYYIYMYVVFFLIPLHWHWQLTVLSHPRPSRSLLDNGRVAVSPSRLSVQYDETRTEIYETLNFML